MKYTYLSVIITFFVLSASAQEFYTNPVIPGFNPDPSICRAGDDYYLATSSFEYFPGVPIYRSKDLVHWQMIGHALHRPSQLNLDNIKCSAGIYAPTLRYHDGTFYMVTTLTGGAGNFIVTATDPAGPWSEPHWIKDAPGIDPSLFFDDDGKVYFCGTFGAKNKVFPTHNNIWVQELDLRTWELVGPKVEVIDGSAFYKSNSRMDGGLETGVNNFEAPHIYKKGDKYYIILAHGGTSLNHAASVWSADHVFGPYKSCPSNPILTHRDLSPDFVFTSTGHADLIQTQTGEWWMVYLAKRPLGGSYVLGRETLMSPVDWSDEWPVVNPKGYVGRAEITHLKPNLSETILPEFPVRDEFDQEKLRPEWTLIRTPRTEWYTLKDKKDWLRIRLRSETMSDQAQPSFIGIRQQHFNFTSGVKFAFEPGNEREEAGIVIERDNNHYFRFVVRQHNGKPQLVLARKDAESGDHVIKEIAPAKPVRYLKVTCEEYRYSFAFSSDGKSWTTLADREDGRFLGYPKADRFTGTFIGMYASSNGSDSNNYADFDWFEYKPATDLGHQRSASK